MDASVIGSNYVGTTLAACLVDLGHDVTAVDIDEETVARLDAGETPPARTAPSTPEHCSTPPRMSARPSPTRTATTS